MTAEQYKDSLRSKKPVVWINGKKEVNYVDHPQILPSVNSVAATYELAQRPETVHLATAHSDLINARVNRFTHLFGSTDDLVAKVKLQRALGKHTGTCFQRCVGMDGMNATFISTWEASKEKHAKFVSWLTNVQKNDEVVCGAMTDPKGDRRKRPAEQPDSYLRVVERRPDGIVLRGAKLHQTGALNSHWVLCMPNTVMKKGEEDFAVVAAVRLDAPGLTFILGRQPSDDRKGTLDAGNLVYGGQEAVVYYDNVFVPNEHVFLDGDLGPCGTLLEAFTGYHRASYGGCKPGNLDVLMGASAEIVKMNGVPNAPHIKDKLIEMAHLTETLHACGLAASHQGKKHASGVFQVDQLLANVCKQNITRLPYEVLKISEDLAGALVSTMPPMDNFDHPELAKIMHNVVGTRERGQMFKLMEYMISGAGSVAVRTECMHGAGSPQAQRMVIDKKVDWEAKMQNARKLAGITK